MTPFRVLHIDLTQQEHSIHNVKDQSHLTGGAELAYFLHQQYFQTDKAWNAPEQPIIFAIGPLTGLFPLMSKMVSAFCSPNKIYTESYAGGRAGLALKFTSFDAIVITGKSQNLSCLELTSKGLDLQDMKFAKGLDPNVTLSFARKICSKGAGKRTIMCIGASGEQGSPLASINVDTYRHFGRMGGGAILGAKNIKVLIIHGDHTLHPPSTTQYNQLYLDIFTRIIDSKSKKKPTSSHLAGLIAQGDIHSGACASCPIGCIHPGFIRKKLEKYRQHNIELGNEPIFWLGKVLQIKASFDILRLLEANERYCFDVLAVATVLYWATKATEEGYISEKETIYPLRFGHAKAYQQAISALAKGANSFYRDLGEGSHKSAQIYGAREHACELGRETAFLSSIAFSEVKQDFKWTQQDVENIVQKAILKQNEKGCLNSMIACLFGKEFYQKDVLHNCLKTAGYEQSFIDNMEDIQKKAWLAGRLENISLSKKFYSTILPKAVNPQQFLVALQKEYSIQMHALYPRKKDS